LVLINLKDPSLKGFQYTKHQVKVSAETEKLFPNLDLAEDGIVNTYMSLQMVQ
jgi:hypothetical protein